MGSRLGMTMQREPRPVLDLRLDRLQEACAVAFFKCQWNAVAIEHAVAGKRCELWPRREDAGEVYAKVKASICRGEIRATENGTPMLEEILTEPLIEQTRFIRSQNRRKCR